MIKTSIDNKHEQEIVIFNECAIPSEEIVQMMMDRVGRRKAVCLGA